MHTHTVQLPKRVVFGIGLEEKIGEEAKGLGAKKALIVTDETMKKSSEDFYSYDCINRSRSYSICDCRSTR